MTETTPRTLDTIHLALERLGYVGEEFGAARLVSAMYGIYRMPGESMTVTWQHGSAVCEVSATTEAALLVLCDALTRKGLMCKPAGTRMNVYGQEYIDAEVLRMLQHG